MTGGSDGSGVLQPGDPAEIGRRLTGGLPGRSRGELPVPSRPARGPRAGPAAVTRTGSRAGRTRVRRSDQLAELDGHAKQALPSSPGSTQRVKGQNRQLASDRTRAGCELDGLLPDLERAAARPGRPAPAPDKAPARRRGQTAGQGQVAVAGQLLADSAVPGRGPMRWDGVLIAAPAGAEIRTIRGARLSTPTGYRTRPAACPRSWRGLSEPLRPQSGSLPRVVRPGRGRRSPRHVGDSGGQPRPALYYEVGATAGP